MTLWWLMPDWNKAVCCKCETRIYPEGDPDWGLCLSCMTEDQCEQQPNHEEEEYYRELEEQHHRELEEQFLADQATAKDDSRPSPTEPATGETRDGGRA